MARLALSDADKEVRDWFVSTTRTLGCEVVVDAMGNIFAVRPGKNKGNPTYIGSHLDTQPKGGRYDGILGVHAGVEMLKLLQETHTETRYPVGVVNWTNEEGARFPCSMVSSAVWAEALSLDFAHSLSEVSEPRRTMKQELQRIGYLGSMPASCKAMPMAAHFELHIEQGPRLESMNKRIGIVSGAQAYRWHTIKVTGQENHTGTTPLHARRDALLSAAKMILASNRIAADYGGLATTGILHALPGSVNTIPGEVAFSLDMRANSDQVLKDMEDAIRQSFTAIASADERNPCQVIWTLDTQSHAIAFHDQAIRCVRDSCDSLFQEKTNALVASMVSGAGHDSVYTNRIAPTAMVFVPCKGGISHHPEEYCRPEDCATGAQITIDAVLRFDSSRV